jgi:hypothetical protein
MSVSCSSGTTRFAVGQDDGVVGDEDAVSVVLSPPASVAVGTR